MGWNTPRKRDICALSPKGVRSITSSTNRGRPKKTQLDIERDAAADETDAALEQVQGNKKTHSGLMATVLGDDWIANDQTGVFPRTSNRGNKYICVFYICDPNTIQYNTIQYNTIQLRKLGKISILPR